MSEWDHTPLPAARRSNMPNPSHALTLAATSLGYVVVQLDVTIVNVALQRVGDALHGGIAELQWIVDAYTIVFASLIPTAGALGDRLGARRVFAAGFVIFTLASVACGAAPSARALVGARAVQGIGAAALVPCSLALINHAFHDQAARAKAVAAWAAGASVALAAGPVVGGVLVDAVGWRSIFLINAPLGLAGIWLTLRFADESPRASGRGLDLGGQLTLITALAASAAAVIEGGRLGVTDPIVIAALAVAVIAGACFLAIEAKGASPMLPLRFFRNATFSAAILIGLLINIAYYGLIFLFSLFFQQAKGYSPLAAGTAFLPMTGGVLVTNLIAGRISGRTGPRLPIVVGLAMLAGGCVVLFGISADTPFAQIWWPLLLMGGGVGFVVPPMTAAVLGAVERTQSGIASGVLNATRQAGSVIGVAVCGSLVADGGHFARGTHVALYLSAALLLLALGVGLGYLSGPTPQRAPVQSSTLPYSGRGGAPRCAHEQQ